MKPLSDRYARQTVLPEIGPGGQAMLRRSTVLIVGCGALGCTQAQLLARSGIGHLRLADRDIVELHNLQRQMLFDETDLRPAAPKAEAAARHLRTINSGIRIESRTLDVTPYNIEALLEGIDLLLDATDNVETRYLINDACVKTGTPWVYGGAVATFGQTMTIRPGAGPCLRCVYPDPPPPGNLSTCDLAGVLNTVPAVVASLQVTEALRLLVGAVPSLPHLAAIDLWNLSLLRLKVAREPECACCGQHRYDFLDGAGVSTASALCGRNAVQVTPAFPYPLGLDALAFRLACAGEVTNTGFLLEFHTGEHDLVIFPDGRAIVRGTNDPAVARSVYARFIGV